MLCKGPEKGHHVSGSGATPLRSPSASPPSFSMQGPGKGSLAFFRKWGDPPPLPLGFFPPPPLALFFPSPSSSPPRALSVSISLALSLPLLLFLRRPWRRPRRRGRAVREEPRRRAVPASAEPRHCRRPLPRARRECRAPPPPFVAAGGSHRREKREKKLMFSSKELGRGKSKHRDSEQQKKLRTHENVQTMSASDPLGISSKVMGSGKRKQIDSEPKKKCTVCTCKECTRKTKGMDSKQQKRQGSLKEDTMESFNVHCFPEHPREKKLRGTKERCKNSEKQKKLDTNSFELFLKYMWSKLSDVKRKTCTYLDCLWFSSYMNEPSYSKVIMWIKKKQIFSRKYVFVPITGWRHWSLLILCHFGESFLSKTKRPCLLLLDSLGNINSMHLEPDIRRYVLHIHVCFCDHEFGSEVVSLHRFVFDIYKSEGCEDEESISKIPLLVPKVPQQRDGESCGIFVLYFIHLFSQDAPEAFNQEGYPYFLTKNWFSYEDIEKFYKEVLHFATTSDAGEETVLRLDEASLGEAALKALPDRQGGPTHNIAPTEPLISGLLAEASRMESSPAQIVEKSPSEVAPHVDSTPVVSEEGGVAETGIY
ncbi:hypothetical protein Taro_034692 [Colocasia esculenta]|uniref:Ubiquitin-like protease family profile domain-containing protein n=1 Tax=Colocasia esculenta TaxID=4460 RepID=A0A843WG89_COLES|nr:hypothetical protein [Colocasia esculenta]